MNQKTKRKMTNEPVTSWAGLVRSFDLSVWALIIANLVPLIGIVLFRWDVGSVLVIYWSENLVVGFYGILRIIFSRVDTPAEHGPKLFLVPFFMIHFGGFCAIHGMFILSFIEMLGSDQSAFDAFPDSDAWPGPLIFVGLLVNVVQQVWVSFGDQIRWPIISLLISHGISFVQNYLYRGEFRDRNPGFLMMAPYGRIVIMHVAILAAALPVMLLGSPLPLLVILVMFKTVADILFHLASHKSGKSSTLGFILENIFKAAHSNGRR